MPTPLRRPPRLARGAIALGLATVMLAGCRSAVEEAQRQAAGGETASCQQGGTLVAASSQAPIPGRILAQGAANLLWVRGVFEPLLAVRDDPANPVKLLASDYALSDDDRTAVLTLRQGVTFHTGRPFTSADVLYTFQQAVAPTSPSNDKPILSGWKIEASGPYEVTIRSAAPLSPVLATVLDDTPILDSETAAGLENGTQIVGTGPFVVESFQPGARMVLARNPHYWQAGLPRLDRIENIVVPDSTAQLAAMRSNRTQLASGMTTQDAQTLTRGNQMVLTPTQQVIYSLVLDPSTPAFGSATARQAIGYAIDRDRIKQQVFGDLGDTAELPWPPEAGADAGPGRTYTYDPDRARAMIEQAGASGAEVPITIINNPLLQSVYQIIANNLTDIGLRPSLRALSAPDYQATLAAQKGGNYLSFRGQNSTPSLIVQTNPDYRIKGGQHPVSSPEYAALATALVGAEPGPEATAAQQRLDERILGDAVVHTVATTPGIAVRTSSLQGLTFTSGGLLSREVCLLR